MTNESRPKYNVLSLFAGAGGLDLGFEQTERFETFAAVEYQPEFAETLRMNQRNGYFPKMRVIEADIRSLDPQQIARESFPNGVVDVVVGGPPCETFSLTGGLAGTNDPRGLLTTEFIDWVRRINPKVFLMENVPRLSVGPNKGYLTGEVKRAIDHGYVAEYRVLCAADYGATTKRQRLILMGTNLNDSLPWPEQSHSDRPSLLHAPYRTVRDALNGLPSCASIDCGIPDHFPAVHTMRVIERFDGLAQGEWDTVRRRGRLRWSEPAPTLFAGTLKSIARHIHPDEPREITNRECARIHGFPDDFVFAGRMAAVCKQIANSVPVDFARALGRGIATLLDTIQTPEVNSERIPITS